MAEINLCQLTDGAKILPVIKGSNSLLLRLEGKMPSTQMEAGVASMKYQLWLREMKKITNIILLEPRGSVEDYFE